jgi:hypothetical protein
MSAMPFPRSFSFLTPLLWVAAMFLLLLAVRSVLQNRSPRKWRDRETIEWGTSSKFDPEMEDEDWQNPIPTAEIFAAADARNRAETSGISARECSRRSAKEAYPTDARALWFDYWCARDQTQRGVRLGETKGIE